MSKVSPFSSRRVGIALSLFGLLGLYNTWGRTILNGTFGKLLVALFGGPYLLPGTDIVMSTKFTGNYWPTDMLFDVMVVFFWEVVDGSHPRTSAIGLYFIGQVLPVTAGMYVDTYRLCHKNKILFSATFWLVIFQCTAIGTSGPIFLAVHLLQSPTHNPTTPATQFVPSAAHLLSLPVSIAIGYLLPTFIIALPLSASFSPFGKQLALAAWGFFPLLVMTSQFIVAPVVQAALATFSSNSEQSRMSTSRAALRLAYAPAILISAFSHSGFLSLASIAWLFPSLFAPKIATQFQPSKLLLPYFGLDTKDTIGEAVAGFMVWDEIFGFAAMLLLAAASVWGINTRPEKRRQVEVGGFGGIAWKLVLAGFVFGPGTTFAGTMWFRDEMILNEAGEAKAKRK